MIPKDDLDTAGRALRFCVSFTVSTFEELGAPEDELLCLVRADHISRWSPDAVIMPIPKPVVVHATYSGGREALMQHPMYLDLERDVILIHYGAIIVREDMLVIGLFLTEDADLERDKENLVRTFAEYGITIALVA